MPLILQAQASLFCMRSTHTQDGWSQNSARHCGSYPPITVALVWFSCQAFPSSLQEVLSFFPKYCVSWAADWSEGSLPFLTCRDTYGFLLFLNSLQDISWKVVAVQLGVSISYSRVKQHLSLRHPHTSKSIASSESCGTCYAVSLLHYWLLFQLTPDERSKVS